MGEEAGLEEAIKLALDEPGQRRPNAGFGVGDEAGRVGLHQAVQRGLLRAVALVVNRTPSGALIVGLGCRPMACTMGSQGSEPVRSQVARRASIAWSAAHRRVPTAAGLLRVALSGTKRRL